MKAYIFLLFTCFLFAIKSYGQPQDRLALNEWHNGALVLNSHDVVRGKVKYNHIYDAVLLEAEGKVSTYAASQVIYFYYIHHSSGVVYQYTTLPYFSRIDSTYQRNYFFEILLQGEVLYLRKANKKAPLIENKNRQKVLPKLNVDKSCYDYYMLYNEKVVCINNFTEDALPLLAQNFPKSIHEFIRSKNIEDFTPHDKLVILHYYNSMRAATEQPRIAAQHSFARDTVKAEPIVRAGYYAE